MHIQEPASELDEVGSYVYVDHEEMEKNVEKQLDNASGIFEIVSDNYVDQRYEDYDNYEETSLAGEVNGTTHLDETTH